MGGVAALEQADPSGSKSWVLPAFGCTAVEYSREWRDKDGVLVSRNRTSLESIRIGEPDLLLFVLSGEEMKPSELHRRFNSRYGLGITSNEAARDAREDELYR